MFKPNFSVYLGQEKEEGFFGFIVEDGVFGVLKIDEGYTKEQGREVLKKLVLKINQNPPDSLASFESILASIWQEHNLPASFSFSGGFLINDVFLLKTIGLGSVFARRHKDFARLIEGNNSASGYVGEGDFFIFTTKEFESRFENDKEIQETISDRDPKEVLDEITPLIKLQEDTGLISLFVSFTEVLETPPVTLEEQAESQPKKNYIWEKKEAFLNFLENLKRQDLFTQRKKLAILIGVVLVFFILIFSIFSGGQSRFFSQNQKKIQSTRELVEERLVQAQDVAFLNQARAVALIAQAKEDVAELKKEVGDKKEVAELERLIASKEKEIFKKENKSAEEFFDLSVEQQDAKGDKIYLDKDQAAILDSQGTIFLLSLSKKSIDKKSSSAVLGSSRVSVFEDGVFFYKKGSGIFKFAEEGSSKKLIDNDKDWGDIRDMNIYNGNLYLLDAKKSDIYKYLVAEEGFSNKSSYFKSSRPNLNEANSLSIDSSVYIGFSNKILKYAAGEQDQFQTSFPNQNLSIIKIYTNSDLEKVYAWDKQRSAIYILAKAGSYEREINSSILAKASDFVVFEKNAYILAGAKIYRISLE